ncbi:MAG: Mur ligase domain-containing protein [Flavonifractor plautii]
MASANIHDYIAPGRRAHLVGIGGCPCPRWPRCSTAAWVHHRLDDAQRERAVEHLRALGIPVTIGHLPESVQGADCVIRTAAVHDDNPEIAAARAAGIPVFERAQAWGAIMRGYKNALCIAGTHGKTTTTSMCTHIIMAARMDPTVMIGGTLPLLGSGYRVGHGDTIILESCEYCNSFLSFFPTVAVILNMEADHLDFFKDLERRGALLPPLRRAGAGRHRRQWCNADDDQNTMHTLAGRGAARSSPSAWSRAMSAPPAWPGEPGLPSFDVVVSGG